jgi:metal-sulfur cluster biosynthetic enzyme
MNPAELDDRFLLERLRLLDDPEIGLNVVDLGMVNTVTHDDSGRVRVELTPTTPNCPMHDQLVSGAKALLESVPGVVEAEVRVVWEPRWTPDRITAAGRDFLNGEGG